MKLRTMMLVATMFATACATVIAGPADIATDHMNAVAAGDVDKVMANYGENAVFQWVGGPLDGVYNGREAIKGVWTKFAKGNAPLTAKIEQVAVSSNPKGSTISANVTFSGKKTIKVRYILVYREGKLVTEIWQIDPMLATSY
jgi:ketosteroid isomerase-like protein